MPEAQTPYASLAISRRAARHIKEEARKSGRKMYVEAELLVMEAVEARIAARAAHHKKK